MKGGVLQRFKFCALAALAALGVLAGCGGDDRLSAEEFSAELQEVDRNVSAAFQRVFEAVGRGASEGDAVPEPARDAAIQAAETEREAADQLDGLTPPEDAEEATDDLVDQARAQADAIEEAANQDGTVQELADAFEEANPDAALSELRDLGYLPDPEQQGGGGAGDG